MKKNKIISLQSVSVILFFIILGTIFGYVITHPPINGLILFICTPIIIIVWIIGCVLFKKINKINIVSFLFIIVMYIVSMSTIHFQTQDRMRIAENLAEQANRYKQLKGVFPNDPTMIGKYSKTELRKKGIFYIYDKESDYFSVSVMEEYGLDRYVYREQDGKKKWFYMDNTPLDN